MRIEIKENNDHELIPVQPEGSEVIGLIARPGLGGSGALVLLESWEFVQITDGVQVGLDQNEVYTAIIKAILADFCDEHIDLVIDTGFSINTVQSWSSGRRIPAFGIIKLLLSNYNIIKR